MARRLSFAAPQMRGREFASRGLLANSIFCTRLDRFSSPVASGKYVRRDEVFF